MDDAIVCVFHHGGKFINDDTLKYEGETITLSFDPDMWSYFVVVSVMKSFEYDNFKHLWYCVGGGLVLENRLKELIDDTSVMHMANLARLNDDVHLYIVYVVSEPEVIHMLEYVTNDQGEVEGHGEVEEEGEEDGDGVEVDDEVDDGEVDGDLEEVHEGQEDGDVVEVDGEVDGDLEGVHEGEEDGDGVQLDGEVDGDLEEVHEGQEDGDVVEVDGEVDGDLEGVHEGEEDGDDVQLDGEVDDGEVDGDLEEVHEGQEDGDVVEVDGEVDGDIEGVHEGEEDGDGVQLDGEVDDDLKEEHEDQEDGDVVEVDVDCDLEGVHEGEEDGDGVQLNGEVDGDLEEVHEGQEDGDVVEIQVEGHGHVQELHEVEEDVHGVEVEVQVEGHGDEEQELNVCEGVVEDEVDLCGWSTSTDEGDVHGNNECLEGLVDVSVECDIDGEINGNVEVEVESLKDSDDVSVECDDHDDRGLSDGEWKSEELVTATDNDEEVNDSKGYERFNAFCMSKSMVDFTWEVGTFFPDKQDILDAVKGYALENGRNIKFVKNDKRRLRMKCFGAKGKCPWTIYCAYMEVVKSWQLRTKNGIHTCSREFNLNLLDAKWLSSKLEKTIRENPKMKGVDIREKVQRKWNIGISRSMAYRAKGITSEHIDGFFKEQYKRIYDYAHELLGRNPDSTVKVHVENNEDEIIFKRFYCCLKACKDNFVCCRPIIGLDGAFLKGKYGGELLIAVGRDGND
ncbi:uncharacterized protein LOC108328650 [Vigna angularis]|uniref:uncharacterized protein LOC108328650 n=1 Tax=Phaseolus angularis TaxID=3914 RepID=UPI0022B491B3|nr:uncharacterized protein LOC108328650 [Vigna angularis]